MRKLVPLVALAGPGAVVAAAVPHVNVAPRQQLLTVRQDAEKLRQVAPLKWRFLSYGSKDCKKMMGLRSADGYAA
jgi:putative SOS response-associated peptidase YedK